MVSDSYHGNQIGSHYNIFIFDQTVTVTGNCHQPLANEKLTQQKLEHGKQHSSIIDIFDFVVKNKKIANGFPFGYYGNC